MEYVRRNRNGDETARVTAQFKVDIQGTLKAMEMLAESLGMFSRRTTKRREKS